MHLRRMAAARRVALAALALAAPSTLGVLDTPFASIDEARAAGVNLKLVNAQTGAALSTLSDGQTITLAELPTRSLDVIAEPGTSTAQSVKFCYDGSCRIENTAPYTLDDTADAAAWTPTVGAHTLTVTAHSAKNATGTVQDTRTIKFSVQNTAPQANTLALKLVNADKQAAIGELADGQTLNLSTLPTRNLDVWAESTGAPVESVKFCLDNSCRTENSAPYSLDDTADPKAWTPTAGAHTLTVSSHTADSAAGTQLATRTVKFSVTAPTTTATTTTTPAPAPAAPTGTVNWRSNFAASTGLPLSSAWQNTPWNIYGGGSVSIVADPAKGKVMRAYGLANQSKDGNQRAEQVPSYTIRQGDTVWLGFDFWSNADLGVSNTWQGPFQMKSSVEGSPPLGLSLNANGIRGLRITSSDEQHNIGPAPAGAWTRIVIGMYIHPDPNKAWVEVWRDGVNVMAREGWKSTNVAKGNLPGGTIFAGSTNYLKFGVYRGPQPFNADFRFANMAIAGTRDTVMR
jgi:hypothetical protein